MNDEQNKVNPAQPSSQVDTIINAAGAQGFINRPEGTVNQHFGDNLDMSGDFRGANINIKPTLGSNSQRWHCPTPLPPPLQFWGRTSELDELTQKLKAEKPADLISLNGLGGMGKTTLARQLAHDLYYESGTNRYFRAVLWVEVTNEPDEILLLERLGQQVEPGFTREPNEHLAEITNRVRIVLQSAIEHECAECGPDRVLMILDDVWENGVEIVQRLIQQVRPPKTTVLITTRAGSVAAKLGVSRHNNQAVNRLAPEAGAELLAGFLEDAPRPELLELSLALDGYPLALKLAAKRLLAEPDPLNELRQHIKQYREELPAGTDFAQLELEQGQSKEENLTKTLYYSYGMLTTQEQVLFKRLGMIAYDQPFDIGLLAALWNLSEEETKVQVKHFQQLGLLEAHVRRYGEGTYGSGVYGGAHPGWYRFHLALHSYTRALLGKDEAERKAAQTNYQDYIIEIAEQFNKLPPEEWEQLNDYLPHIHTVGTELVTLTAKPEPEEALQRRGLAFAFNTQRYLFHRQETRERDWLSMGLRLSRDLHNQQYEVLFLNELGNHYSASGENDTALKHYKQALALSQMTQNLQEKANILTNIGNVYFDLGHKEKALLYYQKALRLLQTMGNHNGEAITLNNMGKVYLALGQKNKALQYYEQALRLLQTLGNQGGEAITLNNIGRVYRTLNKKQKALQYYEQALPLFRAASNRGAEATALNNIGAVYNELGENRKALEYHRQALALFRTVGNQNEEASTLNNIGMAHSALGEQQEALQNYRQALLLCRTFNNLRGEASTLSNIGLAHKLLGEQRQAQQYYEQALPLFRMVGDQYGEVITNFNIGLIYRDLGQLKDAIRYIARCVELEEQIEHPKVEGDGDRGTLAQLKAELEQKSQDNQG